MHEYVDTVIIGGGQAGLAVSYYLTQQGRAHIVLEQASQAAEAWRNHRWDSFTLVTPNWMTRIPGAEYRGEDPDGFMPRDEVVALIEEWTEAFHPPIRYGVRATSVEASGDGYVVRVDGAPIQASNVVIATGLFQQPRIPLVSTNLAADIKQLHSSEYCNPADLPAGAVLVVGSAQSGAQIAEELYQSGRQVYLSVSSAGRAPRRYRGKDLTWWFDKTGLLNQIVDELPSAQAKFAPNPQATGKDGGHTLNLHQFARDGVVLLGRVKGAQGSTIILASDLKDSLAQADQSEANLVKLIDDYIENNGMKLPKETLPDLRDGYDSAEILELNLNSAGVTTVIWATGYTFDFSLVRLPVVDADGFPIQKWGVTDFPGLYFVGLPWLHDGKSGILFGVGDDAAHIVSHISAVPAKAQ